MLSSMMSACLCPILALCMPEILTEFVWLDSIHFSEKKRYLTNLFFVAAFVPSSVPDLFTIDNPGNLLGKEVTVDGFGNETRKAFWTHFRNRKSRIHR